MKIITIKKGSTECLELLNEHPLTTRQVAGHFTWIDNNNKMSKLNLTILSNNKYKFESANICNTTDDNVKIVELHFVEDLNNPQKEYSINLNNLNYDIDNTIFIVKSLQYKIGEKKVTCGTITGPQYQPGRKNGNILVGG